MANKMTSARHNCLSCHLYRYPRANKRLCNKRGVMLGRQDYLSAPMPFLMGVHAPNLFKSTLRSAAMEEIVVVDLDRGTTTAAAGGTSSPGVRAGRAAIP